jgi:hypothetical protein
MKTLCSLGIAAGLLAFACAAHAVPTLTGSTGGLSLPTANTNAAGAVTVAADYYAVNSAADQLKGFVPIRAVYGLTKDLEVGVGYTDGKTDIPDATYNYTSVYSVNAKYAIPMNACDAKWALGGSYSQTKINALGSVLNNYGENVFDTEKMNTTQLYFVGTRALVPAKGTTPAIIGTLGVNWTQLKADYE